MTQKKNRRVGPNGKQKLISSQVRKDIHAGILKPGDKLPARIAFEARYKCVPVTVQNAFDRLKEDGSIVINSNKGTFVSDTPPCLSTYAIVFPFDPKELQYEVSFYGALAQLAEKDPTNSNCQFKIYKNINGQEDEEDFVRLYNDVTSESLAGVVFVIEPFCIKKTELFQELINRAYLPKVIMTSHIDDYPCFSTISLLQEDVVKKIFDFLESKRITRLCVLSALAGLDGIIPYEKEIFEEAEKRGIELPRYNFQSKALLYASRAQELVLLMLSRSEDQCPQALWITNDTLVEAATKGILESGLRVPENLIVVSHCNFPENTKSSVETSRYGLNVRTFVDTALDIMRNHRRADNKPSHRSIPVEYYMK